MTAFSIVLLAMIAAFLGMRLYSVLGKRTGHEQEPVLPRRDDRAAPAPIRLDDGDAPALTAPATDTAGLVPLPKRAFASCSRPIAISTPAVSCKAPKPPIA